MRMKQTQLRRRRGVVLIWVALLLFVLVGFVGLAIDWGFVVWTGQKLQNAADAAAMAGAQRLGEDEAAVRDAAVYLAAQNQAAGAAVELDPNEEANAADGDVVLGDYDHDTRTFTPTTESPNAVLVHARRTAEAHGGVPLFFGPIFGMTTADVSRFAIAIAEQGPSESSVIALDPNDRRSFYLHGNPILDLGDGSVQVNSNHATEAGLITGNSTLLAGAVNLVGDLGYNGNSYTYDGEENPGSDFVPDPLSGLAAPPDGPAGTRNNQTVTAISESGTYTAGHYPDGLNLNAQSNVMLLPGVYVIENGFTINGGAVLNADRVMFYIKSGEVRHNGDAETRISPPTEGDYMEISFFQARTNTSAAHFVGHAPMGGYPTLEDGTGVFYFPNALLDVGGTADVWLSRLIANTIEVRGDGTKTVVDGYDTNEGTDIIYLVE